jgi:carbonic anhydrase
MGVLESLLERNGRVARPIGPAHPRLCVVACDDAALTGRLEPALGLEPGEATLVRLAGAGGALPEEWVARAVFKATVLDGCDDVLLLTHDGCSAESVQANTVLDALARRGVSRAAVPWDIRDSVGAGRDVRTGVRDLAGALRRAAYLPENVSVHIAHLALDGTLQIIERGDALKVKREAAAGSALSSAPGPIRLTSSEPAVAPGPVNPPAVVPVDCTPTPIQIRRVEAAPSAPALGDAHSALAQMLQARPAPKPKHPKGKPSPSRPPTLPPDVKTPNAALANALAGLRVFMLAELKKPQRAEMDEELTAAHQRGTESPALVKLVLDPILKLGETRYRVIDEMIAVKEALAAVPPKVAVDYLRNLLR